MDLVPVKLPVKLKVVPPAAQWHSWLAIGAVCVAQSETNFRRDEFHESQKFPAEKTKIGTRGTRPSE
jgi:hypothetical protein